MEEKEILLKVIEGLNATVASLSATNKEQSEQIKDLQERIKELTAQVAWLNRQLFGRKSEKLRAYDPNMPDLFFRGVCRTPARGGRKAGRGCEEDREGICRSPEAESSDITAP